MVGAGLSRSPKPEGPSEPQSKAKINNILYRAGILRPSTHKQRASNSKAKEEPASQPLSQKGSVGAPKAVEEIAKQAGPRLAPPSRKSVAQKPPTEETEEIPVQPAVRTFIECFGTNPSLCSGLA